MSYIRGQGKAARQADVYIACAHVYGKCEVGARFAQGNAGLSTHGP